MSHRKDNHPAMIRIDDRTGSAELAPLFLPYGITVSKERLPFGDLEHKGCGPGGTTAMIGYERKRIDDLVQSMTERRLSGHQLPGMIERYDYIYIIVEGIWRPRPSDGMLEVLGGSKPGGWVCRGVQARSVHNYLMGLSLRAGVFVWRTTGPKETVQFVIDQYRMWEKEWDEHKAHDQVYAPAGDVSSGGLGGRLVYKPRKATGLEKVAMQAPGLDARAVVVGKRWASIREMCLASKSDWAELRWKGKRFGGKLADKIDAWLDGREVEE